MINVDYIKYMHNAESLSKKIDIPIEYIEEFFNISYVYVKNITEQTLNEMKQNKQIKFKEVIMVKSTTGKIYQARRS